MPTLIHPQLQSPLLRLPAELRNRIYELALYNNGLGLQYCEGEFSGARPPRLLPPQLHRPPEMGFPMRPAFNQLQYTCRILQLETNGIEARDNDPIFTPGNTVGGVVESAFARFERFIMPSLWPGGYLVTTITLCSLRPQSSDLDVPAPYPELETVARFAQTQPLAQFNYRFVGVRPSTLWGRLRLAAHVAYAVGPHNSALQRILPSTLAEGCGHCHLGRAYTKVVEWRGRERSGMLGSVKNMRFWFEGLGSETLDERMSMADEWAARAVKYARIDIGGLNAELFELLSFWGERGI